MIALTSRLPSSDIMVTVIRTQISLTEAQHAALRELAATRGESMSEVIRQAVDETLRAQSREDRIDRAVGSLGGFRSGHADTAESHDSVLDRAYST